MKKLIAVMMVLCMFAMMAAAGAEADYTGTWFMTKGGMGDLFVSPADMGVAMSLELKADDKAELTTLSYTLLHVEKGSWAEADGTITFAGEEGSMIHFTVDGETMKATISDLEFYFEKTGAEPLKAPEKVAIQDAGELNGMWALDLVSTGETLFQPKEAGIDGSLFYLCRDGVVTEFMIPNDENGEMSKFEMACELKDGELTTAQTEASGVLVNISFVKLDNGTMTMYHHMEGLDTVAFHCSLYCTLEEFDQVSAEPETAE